MNIEERGKRLLLRRRATAKLLEPVGDRREDRARIARCRFLRREIDRRLGVTSQVVPAEYLNSSRGADGTKSGDVRNRHGQSRLRSPASRSSRSNSMAAVRPTGPVPALRRDADSSRRAGKRLHVHFARAGFVRRERHPSAVGRHLRLVVRARSDSRSGCGAGGDPDDGSGSTSTRIPSVRVRSASREASCRPA